VKDARLEGTAGLEIRISHFTTVKLYAEKTPGLPPRCAWGKGEDSRAEGEWRLLGDNADGFYSYGEKGKGSQSVNPKKRKSSPRWVMKNKRATIGQCGEGNERGTVVAAWPANRGEEHNQYM